MQVTRIKDVKSYDAAKHYGMEAFRLQGLDVTDLESFSCGLSYFQPGGGAERSCSQNEKVYVVLDGEITVITDQGETLLEALDSCAIGVGEYRSIENRSSGVATLLVIISKNIEPAV